MADLGRLKKRRSGHRLHIKSLETEVNTVLEKYDPSLKPKLESLKSNLTTQLKKISELDDGIIDLVDEEDVEGEVQDSQGYHDKFFDILANLDHCLQSSKGSEVEQNQQGSSAASTHKLRSLEAKVKLPKIELPKFDGNSVNWQSFWDQFESSIDKNDGLSNVDKFAYLKNLLCGNAASTISGLSLTNENYMEAVDLLKERFGNPQVLINAHMENLVKLPKVNSMNNIKEVRIIYDKVEATVRNLKSLGINTNSYGSLLVPLLNEKLPEELKIIISRKFGNNVWILEDMLKYFKEELQAKETCIQQSPSPGSSSFQRYEKERRSPATASALLTQTSRPNCVYCRSPTHASSQCSIVTDINNRKAILRKYARCFVCTRAGHISRDCSSNYTCRKCGKKHHISICELGKAKHASVVNQIQGPSTTSVSESDQQETHTMTTGSKNNVLLQTALADVSNVNMPEYIEKARLLFDGGSQRTYVSNELRNKLQLPTIRRESVMVQTFGTKQSTLKTLDVVQLCVKGKANNITIYVEALCTPVVCSPLCNQKIELVQGYYPHLADLDLADSTNGTSELKIDALIGLDYYYSFVTGRVKRGPCGPVAMESNLGWILGGAYHLPGGEKVVTTSCVTHVLFQSIDNQRAVLAENFARDELRMDLEKFWNIETLGLANKEDDVMHQFESHVEFNGTRYVTKLPFKDSHSVLPDNYSLSVGRFSSLRRKLNANKKLCEDYAHIFEDYKEQGIIEEVKDSGEPGKVHYLPHRPVVREERETTKVRAVFDASAKSEGPSLNDCLFSGPCLLPLSFDILLRFRMNKIGLVSDIRQAFLQIEIAEEHKNFLRFLWAKNINDEKSELIIMRFNRVVFGVTSSPFLLNATIHHHMQSSSYEEQFAKKFLQDLYVDDCTTTVESVEEGFEFYKQSKSAMKEGGFELRKWASNSKELNDKINTCEREQMNINNVSKSDDGSYTKSFFGNDDNNRKVLGIAWNIESDKFVFKFEDFVNKALELKVTKRNILRVAASLYDPLGLLSPIVIQLKAFFQMLCADKREWDELVPEKILQKWQKFLHELWKLSSVEVPRFIGSPVQQKVISVELHGFGDSSETAYVAAIFIRVETITDIYVKLLCAKSRVAPLRKQTIPRLELLSSLVLSKLITTTYNAIKSEIAVSEIVCWSDSEIALYWITSTNKQRKVWVENRVQRIRKNVPEKHWRHVPGKLNPADIPTREFSPSELQKNCMWWEGPKFLLSSKDQWPENKITTAVETEEDKLQTITCLLSNETSANVNLEAIIDCSKYSTFRELIKITCLVLRFKNNLLRKMKKEEIQVGEITVKELELAEELLILNEQKRLINSDKFQQLSKSLDLFFDERKLLRLNGRLRNANIPYEQKHPLLLPSGSHLTKLIIWDRHKQAAHSGVQATLNRLRSQFWIVRGRQTIKKLLNKCVVCRMYQGRPLVPPPTPELPTFRLCAEYGFANTGIDHAGPLFVKDIYGDSTKTHKAYICLFTCATTRAIHLELVPDLSSSSTIRALKRFIARKGLPNFIISDNFKSFKALELRQFLRSHLIQWDFILPSAPWWGGFYERMVRITKNALRKVLGNARLDFEELSTVLVEIENVINSRPLTYLNKDDETEALTPFHLLFGRNINNRLKKDFVDNIELNAEQCNERVSTLQLIQNQFWNRFHNDYLNQLREKHCYVKGKFDINCKVDVGDLVLIKEDKHLPRNQWKKGRITNIIKGNDGMIRGVELHTCLRDGKKMVIKRPVQKIIPLEITKNQEQVINADTSYIQKNPENDEPERNSSGRPKRKAALTGQIIRKLTEQQ